MGTCLRRRSGERLSWILPDPTGCREAELCRVRERVRTGGRGARGPRGRRTAESSGRRPGPVKPPRLLVGDQTPGQAGFLAGRRVAVDHALGDRFVERADCLEDGGARVAARLGDRGSRGLDRGADLGADGAVAEPAVLALPNPLHGRLGVRQPETPSSSKCGLVEMWTPNDAVSVA